MVCLHGWINGNNHQSFLDADFGDVYNFIHHVKDSATENNKSIFAFDTGDLTQGTGLSDATPTQGEFIFNIAKKIPYSGLTVGNHELGSEACVDLIANDFAPYWQGKFISANVEYKDPYKKFADKYFNISLPNGQGRIVVLGFLYNLGSAAANIKITKVADTLTKEFMNEALQDSSDPSEKIRLVVSLCHIATDSAETEEIRRSIRSKLPKVPLILLTGHSHMYRTRNYSTYSNPPDKYSFAMESAYYLTQIGRISVILSDSESVDPIFEYRFINGTKDDIQKAAGFINGTKGDILWETDEGTEIRKLIKEKYEELRLSEVIGNAPKTFYRNPAYAQIASGQALYSYIVDQMMPDHGPYSQLAIPECNTVDEVITVGVLGPSSVRYDLYEGPVILNDIFTIDPFNDQLFVFEGVDGVDMQKVMGQDTNQQIKTLQKEFIDYGDKKEISNVTIDPTKKYEIVATSYDYKGVQTALNKVVIGKYSAKETSIGMRQMLIDYVKKYWSSDIDPQPTEIDPSPTDTSLPGISKSDPDDPYLSSQYSYSGKISIKTSFIFVYIFIPLLFVTFNV
ncbi:MAG: putative 5' nucleotidase family protein [Streblomastix strix]|uniref:Putative 5' nucleotidase family protein n=1 Tax=Streblomastix strix TaxID=222440 RepID=A0A5J4V5W0_9EUKA|nr:MAG: putative 5' nucleotidase family protein [Streblomastix strix]